MHMFDQGNGPPVIVVPGAQGRWEWMAPALRELKGRCRTVSYTLAGDIGADYRVDPALGFDNYVRQLDGVFDRTGLDRAAICGVSYGGFVAVRYAALRPERVSSLILVSAPAPGWRPNDRQRRYMSRPWRSVPAFVLTAPLRLWPEVLAAFGTWRGRLAFAVRHGVRVISAPMIPPVMAARVQMQQARDFTADCARVQAPTLVITGEDGLDHVVPVDVTRRYETLIDGAQYTRIDRSGHIGMLTQPARFADIVTGFVHANHH